MTSETNGKGLAAEPDDGGVEALAKALDYARTYWHHGQEPRSQAALTTLAHALTAARERVRVVEGERDAEAERVRYLETELAADARHAALKPGESCDVCTHLESEQVQEWMARDVDLADELAARAYSAEAAHAALRAGVEALATKTKREADEEWTAHSECCDMGDTDAANLHGEIAEARDEHHSRLRSLLDGATS